MKLFILTKSSNGSAGIELILDIEVLNRLQELVDKDLVDPYYCPGYGDEGFDYTTITVPDDSTAASLGLSESHFMTMDDVEALASS